MSSNPIKLCFAGSGQLAVPVLKSLLDDNRFVVTTIITQPDKPAGRKKKLTPCPVGQFCEEHQLPVLKPKSVNQSEVLQQLQEENPDFIVVASFGQLLKKDFLSIPKLGCFNVHASLLPNWRGASPITAVILNGETEAGISFMAMDEGLDTGAVYQKHKIKLDGTETTESLENALANLAAQTIGQCLQDITQNQCSAQPQPEGTFPYAGKIKKEHGQIDWNDDAAVSERKIRAYFPWPKAYFRLYFSPDESMNIQVTRAEVVSHVLRSEEKPGDILEASPKNGLIIACQNNALKIQTVIPEGKREMPIADFLRGRQLTIGGNVSSTSQQ